MSCVPFNVSGSQWWCSSCSCYHCKNSSAINWNLDTWRNFQFSCSLTVWFRFSVQFGFCSLFSPGIFCYSLRQFLNLFCKCTGYMRMPSASHCCHWYLILPCFSESCRYSCINFVLYCMSLISIVIVASSFLWCDAVLFVGASGSVRCCSLSVVWLMTFVHFTVISIKLGMSSSRKVRQISDLFCCDLFVMFRYSFLPTFLETT